MRSLLRRIYFTLFYLNRPPWDTGVSPPELHAYIRTHAPGRAIDLGCGTGTNVLTLLQAGWQVTGVDFVAGAIRAARKRIARAGLQADLRRADVTDLREVQGPFDLALDIGCFHSLGRGKERYLAGLERLLAPGGGWLLYTFLEPVGSEQGHGLTDAQLARLQASFEQVWRQDGYERNERPSAWMLFRKPGR